MDGSQEPQIACKSLSDCLSMINNNMSTSLKKLDQFLKGYCWANTVKTTDMYKFISIVNTPINPYSDPPEDEQTKLGCAL